MKLFRVLSVILRVPKSRIWIILMSGIKGLLFPRRISYVELLLAISFALKPVNIKLLFILVIAIFIKLR